MKRLGQLQLVVILIIGLVLVGTPLVALHGEEQETNQQEQYLSLLDKGAVEFEIAGATLTNYQMYDLEISYKNGALEFTNLGTDSDEVKTAIGILQNNQPFCNAMLILGREAIADSVHVSESEVGFSLVGLKPTDKAELYFDPSHQMNADGKTATRLAEDWVLKVEQQ